MRGGAARAALAQVALTPALLLAAISAHASAPATPPSAVANHTVDSVTALGLSLLRAQAGVPERDSPANTVVSPVSLASGLALIHAGAATTAANELTALMGPDLTFFADTYPALLRRLHTQVPELSMVNRVWIGRATANKVEPSYLKVVQERYAADAQPIDFRRAEPARSEINQWAADRTAKRIAELLPAGAVTGNTKLIATNAIHFRAPWAQPFQPAASAERSFVDETGAAHMVRTMSQTMRARVATVADAQVLELAFESDRFALVIAQVPAGKSLAAFGQSLSAAAWRAWSSELTPIVCTVELPAFSIAPRNVSLKKTLQSLGVKTAFTAKADFAPMLGARARGVRLDDVFQSAGITVNEQGAEAVAATAAVMASKSMLRAEAHPACQVNRPFMFAITELATGTPVFMGKIGRPAP